MFMRDPPPGRGVLRREFGDGHSLVERFWGGERGRTVNGSGEGGW